MQRSLGLTASQQPAPAQCWSRPTCLPQVPGRAHRRLVRHLPAGPHPLLLPARQPAVGVAGDEGSLKAWARTQLRTGAGELHLTAARAGYHSALHHLLGQAPCWVTSHLLGQTLLGHESPAGSSTLLRHASLKPPAPLFTRRPSTSPPWRSTWPGSCGSRGLRVERSRQGHPRRHLPRSSARSDGALWPQAGMPASPAIFEQEHGARPPCTLHTYIAPHSPFATPRILSLCIALP